MSINPERYIAVGKVGAPTGLSGAVKITSFTESPEDIFEYEPWYIRKNNEWLEVMLEEATLQGKYLIAKFAGCNDRDQAQQWTNSEISVKRSQLPTLPEGQYYWSDLEGLEVRAADGAVFGNIDEIMETGANPVIVIVGEKRYLVPYLPHVVKEVDLNSNYMIVDWDMD